MRLALPCAAAAALLGCSWLAGCAKLPASPVPAPLTDLQAISMAEDYLDDRDADEVRFVNYVEPTGDGNLVSFRSSFDAGARPPVATRLVKVDHDGSVRELRFRKGR